MADPLTSSPDTAALVEQVLRQVAYITPEGRAALTALTERLAEIETAASDFLDASYEFSPERYRHYKRRLEIALGREPVTEEIVIP